jgi:hypothetical protein
MSAPRPCGRWFVPMTADGRPAAHQAITRKKSLAERLSSPFNPWGERPLAVWPVFNLNVLIDPGAPGPRGVPPARRHQAIEHHRPSDEPNCSLANVPPPWMWSWVPTTPFSEMEDFGLFTGARDTSSPERPRSRTRGTFVWSEVPLGRAPLLILRAGPTSGLR